MGILDFLKSKKPIDRYEGKPFLKLVDSFILKCIGELDSNEEVLLKKMEPKLQRTYNSEGTWEEIVMEQLDFELNIVHAIQDLWVKNQAIAKEHGKKLSPLQFTEMFVANNVTNT